MQGWKASSELHLPDIWYYLEAASDKWTLSLKSCEEFSYSTLKIFWGKGGCKLLTMWSSLQAGTKNALMYWGSHVVHRKEQRVAGQLKISSCNSEKHLFFFFALPQLKREIRAWNLVFLKNGIVWFPSRSPGTIKAGREASLIDNLTKMSIVFGMPLFSAVSGWPKRSLFMQASCIMCCWAKCSFHSYETAAITITAS